MLQIKKKVKLSISNGKLIYKLLTKVKMSQ